MSVRKKIDVERNIAYQAERFRYKPQFVSESEKIRSAQITAYVPGLWTARSVLYIGANVRRFHFAYVFKNVGDKMEFSMPISQRGRKRFDVIEIHRQRAKELKEAHGWISRVIVGDVRDIDNLPIEDHYHAVIWSHGPTLLPYKDIEPTIDKLESIAYFLVICCPWGKYKHDPANKDHELDTNVTELRPGWFVDRGFAVHCIGKPHQNGSNILAWKMINEKLYSRGIGL